MGNVIYITIDGGMVTDVHASDPKLAVVVIDHDTLDEVAQQNAEQLDKALEEKIEAGEVVEIY